MKHFYPFHLKKFHSDEIYATAEQMRIVQMDVEYLSDHEQQNPLCKGRLLASEVQTGLFVTGGDFCSIQDHILSCEVESTLVCAILLAGHANPMQVNGKMMTAYMPQRSALYHFSTPAMCSTFWQKDQQCTISGFSLQAHFFEKFSSCLTDEVFLNLKQLFSIENDVVILPGSQKIIDIAYQNINHPYIGVLSEIFLESNTLALVLDVAQRVYERKVYTEKTGIKYYDAVMYAKEILDSHLIDTPKSLNIAEQVGVNITTLQQQFKSVFGMTMFHYVRSQRLEIAKVLLQDQQLSIAEIGYRVGFSNPSAFSAAYKQMFAITPQQSRSKL